MNMTPSQIDRREARVVYPVRHARGHTRPEVEVEVENYLAGTFGGFTRTEGIGSDPNVQTCNRLGDQPAEKIVIYDVAVEVGDDENWRALRRLAEYICEKMGQVGVYVRWPDQWGHVSFVGDPEDEDTIPFRAREPREGCGEAAYREVEDGEHHTRGDLNFYGWNRNLPKSDAVVRAEHGERVEARRRANRSWRTE